MASVAEPNLSVAISTRTPAASVSGSYSRILRSWWIAFFASALFVVTGHLLIKAGLNSLTLVRSGPQHNGAGLTVILQPELLGGLLVYLFGTVCWMRAVSLKEISFLYPLSSMNYVLVAAASAVLFHEVISPRRAAGIVVIVLGMALMNHQSNRESR